MTDDTKTTPDLSPDVQKWARQRLRAAGIEVEDSTPITMSFGGSVYEYGWLQIEYGQSRILSIQDEDLNEALNSLVAYIASEAIGAFINVWGAPSA